MRTAITIFAAAFAFTGAAIAQDIPTSGAGAQLSERHDIVAGAEADLIDAQAYLAQLKAGNFAGIFAIDDDGAMRCGEIEANAACAPLTDTDKAEAIAEARDMVAAASIQLADAQSGLEGGVESANYTP